MRDVVLAQVPDDFGNDEGWSSDRNRFRLECCTAGRRKNTGRTLARVFSGDAFRQFALICALAETNFEKRPILTGGLRGHLPARERTDDELENKHIGGEPADRPPPIPEISRARLLHCEPLSNPNRNP